MSSGGEIVDPRFDRFRPLSNALGWALVAVAVLAAASVALPSPWGARVGVVLVATLVVVPIARVVWLIARWIRRGDRRYAAVGTGVLVVIAAGALLALR